MVERWFLFLNNDWTVREFMSGRSYLRGWIGQVFLAHRCYMDCSWTQLSVFAIPKHVPRTLASTRGFRSVISICLINWVQGLRWLCRDQNRWLVHGNQRGSMILQLRVPPCGTITTTITSHWSCHVFRFQPHETSPWKRSEYWAESQLDDEPPNWWFPSSTCHVYSGLGSPPF